MVGHLYEIIIYVIDMGKQVSFYRDSLGLNIIYPTELNDYSEQTWVLFDAGMCKLALHSGKEQPSTSNSHKIVFQVENIDLIKSRLENMGVILGDIRSPAANIYVSDGLDPEGNPFSIEMVRKE